MSRPRGRPTKPGRIEMLTHAQHLRERGEDWATIAASLGVPRASLRRACRALRARTRLADAISRTSLDLSDLEDDVSSEDGVATPPSSELGPIEFLPPPSRSAERRSRSDDPDAPGAP
jgi:hypothetical protein